MGMCVRVRERVLVCVFVCVSARAWKCSPVCRDSEQWSCDLQDGAWLSPSYPVIGAGNHGVRHPGAKPRA